MFIVLTYTRRIIATIVICIAINCVPSPEASAQPHEEYQVKTAFLYNFVKFIDWPTTTVDGPKTPFTFCIISRETMPVLNKELQDRRIGNHAITIKHLQSPDQINDQVECQVLFIHRSMMSEAKKIIDYTGSYPTLLVGDEIDLARKGGDINFIKRNNRIRFEINIEAAQKKGLTISSDLLKLATIVSTGDTAE